VPEGHTLRIAANRLQPLVGHEVAVEAPQARHRFAGFDALDGQVLEEVRAVGKHLLLRFEDGRTVHSHLRMRGSWQVYRDGQPWRWPRSAAWLVLRADGWTAVQFRGPVLELLGPGKQKLHPVLSRLGPDLLADELDVDQVVARVRRRVDPGVQAGDLLLDQRVVCGIGNLYKSEALWVERVDPFAPIGALDDALLGAVYAEARRQMLAAVAGGREAPHRIYRQPACPRCRGPVSSRAQGDEGRTTYWCERCLAFPSNRLP
jgi:endonuclease VIII